MAARSEFTDFLLDMLSPLSNVRTRAMFGGHGLYQDGVFFAIVSNGVLYLKTDDVNRPAFEARGLGAFTYKRKGQTLALQYFAAPPEALEDQVVLLTWARSAIDAGLRARR